MHRGMHMCTSGLLSEVGHPQITISGEAEVVIKNERQEHKRGGVPTFRHTGLN